MAARRVEIALPFFQVDPFEARFQDLVARAEAGEEIVLSRGATPVVKMVAVRAAASKPTPVFGSMKDVLEFDERFLEPLGDEVLRNWD